MSHHFASKRRAESSSSGVARHSVTESSDASTPSSVEETPVFLANALQQFEQAIQLLPAEKTAVYCTAQRLCPGLVSKEANPVHFLRCCHWNPWDAAARFMEYWKLRLEVFGPDRCYRCLEDLSGQGACDEQNIRIVETGVCYLLQTDCAGRPVLLLDRSKFSPRLQKKWSVTVQDKLRASFYLLHTLAQQQPEASRNGVVLLQLVTMKDPKVYPAVNRFATRAMKECFPFFVKEYHVVFAPFILEKRKRSMFADKIVPFWQQFVRPSFYFANVHFHMVWGNDKGEESSQAVVLSRVLQEKVGLQPKALPPVAGGKWSFAQYKRWYNAQQQERLAESSSETTVASTTASLPASATLPSAAGGLDHPSSSLNLLALVAEAALEPQATAASTTMTQQHKRMRREENSDT